MYGISSLLSTPMAIALSGQGDGVEGSRASRRTLYSARFDMDRSADFLAPLPTSLTWQETGEGGAMVFGASGGPLVLSVGTRAGAFIGVDCDLELLGSNEVPVSISVGFRESSGDEIAADPDRDLFPDGWTGGSQMRTIGPAPSGTTRCDVQFSFPDRFTSMTAGPVGIYGIELTEVLLGAPVGRSMMLGFGHS
ncbi:hypothetical protein CLV78_1277 [Aliiruegeria haliotis]|uniref:Uncharacterized protein n=1 Tax=Aliiruegeria haliotis TaxID=1280846 RepID=A0A2T0RDI3_9RHOB|nr:hypothetical protein CLV78_1277 [Aliiruegeria haliotis]